MDQDLSHLFDAKGEQDERDDNPRVGWYEYNVTSYPVTFNKKDKKFYVTIEGKTFSSPIYEGLDSAVKAFFTKKETEWRKVTVIEQTYDDYGYKTGVDASDRWLGQKQDGTFWLKYDQSVQERYWVKVSYIKSFDDLPYYTTSFIITEPDHELENLIQDAEEIAEDIKNFSLKNLDQVKYFFQELLALSDKYAWRE